jgi:hypothetical protein
LDFFPSGSGTLSPFYDGRVLTAGNLFNAIGDFTAIPGSGATARQTLA